MRSVKPHLQHTGTRMTKRMLPFTLVYHDKDQQLTLALHDNPVTLTRDEVDGLIFHLDSFLLDMDKERKPQRSAEGGDHGEPQPSAEGADIRAEAHGEMLMAQYDDDPNPYHGDYSED